MGQRSAKPAVQPQPQEPVEDLARHPPGFVPRSALARAACNARRVRRLIKAGRLGPCWAPLEAGEGVECPVCMEVYAKLNHTACCHQDICTECFICIVAPSGGASARCPYCQASALQVYLPPPGCTCATGSCRQRATPPTPTAEGTPGPCPPVSAPASPARRALLYASGGDSDDSGGDNGDSGRSSDGSGGSSASSTAASPQPSGALSELLEVEGTPPNSPFASASAAAVAASHTAQTAQAAAGLAAQAAKEADSNHCCGVAGPLLPPAAARLAALAEASAEASRGEGPAVVMMVLAAGAAAGDQPPHPDDAGDAHEQGTRAAGGSSSSSSSGGALAAAGVPHTTVHGESAVLLQPAAAALPAGGSAEPGGARVEAEAAPEACATWPAGVPALAGGPALLLNPDGTEQLVLLSSGLEDAAEEEEAAGSRPGQALGAPGEQGRPEEPSLPSYQAPATPEDERMRQAIAQADAALLRQRPPVALVAPASRRGGASLEGSGSGGGRDWLERLRRADAALQAAVARSDQQCFGAGSSTGGGGDAEAE